MKYKEKPTMFKELERVVQDVNGKYLCQTSFEYPDGYTTEWHTVNITGSKKDAKAYFDNQPDWVRSFKR